MNTDPPSEGPPIDNQSPSERKLVGRTAFVQSLARIRSLTHSVLTAEDQPLVTGLPTPNPTVTELRTTNPTVTEWSWEAEIVLSLRDYPVRHRDHRSCRAMVSMPPTRWCSAR